MVPLQSHWISELTAGHVTLLCWDLQVNATSVMLPTSAYSSTTVVLFKIPPLNKGAKILNWPGNGAGMEGVCVTPGLVPSTDYKQVLHGARWKKHLSACRSGLSGQAHL